MASASGRNGRGVYFVVFKMAPSSANQDLVEAIVPPDVPAFPDVVLEALKKREEVPDMAYMYRIEYRGYGQVFSGVWRHIPDRMPANSSSAPAKKTRSPLKSPDREKERIREASLNRS